MRKPIGQALIAGLTTVLVAIGLVGCGGDNGGASGESGGSTASGADSQSGSPVYGTWEVSGTPVVFRITEDRGYVAVGNGLATPYNSVEVLDSTDSQGHYSVTLEQTGKKGSAGKPRLHLRLKVDKNGEITKITRTFFTEDVRVPQSAIKRVGDDGLVSASRPGPGDGTMVVVPGSVAELGTQPDKFKRLIADNCSADSYNETCKKARKARDFYGKHASEAAANRDRQRFTSMGWPKLFELAKAEYGLKLDEDQPNVTDVRPASGKAHDQVNVTNYNMTVDCPPAKTEPYYEGGEVSPCDALLSVIWDVHKKQLAQLADRVYDKIKAWRGGDPKKMLVDIRPHLTHGEFNCTPGKDAFVEHTALNECYLARDAYSYRYYYDDMEEKLGDYFDKRMPAMAKKMANESPERVREFREKFFFEPTGDWRCTTRRNMHLGKDALHARLAPKLEMTRCEVAKFAYTHYLADSGEE